MTVDRAAARSRNNPDANPETWEPGMPLYTRPPFAANLIGLQTVRDLVQVVDDPLPFMGGFDPSFVCPRCLVGGGRRRCWICGEAGQSAAEFRRDWRASLIAEIKGAAS